MLFTYIFDTPFCTNGQNDLRTGTRAEFRPFSEALLGPLTEIQPLILDYWERSIIDQSKSIFIHQQRVHHHGGPPPPNPAAGTGAAGSGSNGGPPPPAAPSGNPQVWTLTQCFLFPFCKKIYDYDSMN